MTEAEYVKCQIALGRRIHEHDGVFWQEVYPFYCKPVFIYKPLEPGEARPARLRSLLGYSHQVRSSENGNRSVELMILDGEALSGFSIEVLSANKRSTIRRGMKRCSIQLIEKFESLLERIREINIAQAIRQEQGAGAETPVRRYTKEADAWRGQVLREFFLGGREWLGAFVDGVLVSYMRTYQVEGILVIEQTKTDPSYYKFYPMDALYYSVLSNASADSTCKLIINGRPEHQSLNHYKEQFLFKAVGYPWYSTYPGLVEWVKRRVS